VQKRGNFVGRMENSRSNHGVWRSVGVALRAHEKAADLEGRLDMSEERGHIEGDRPAIGVRASNW
jgi:hypothetical protein